MEFHSGLSLKEAAGTVGHQSLPACLQLMSCVDIDTQLKLVLVNGGFWKGSLLNWKGNKLKSVTGVCTRASLL